LFAIPRPFRGHYGIIQRNAIRSWTLLQPAPQIILTGIDEGTAEIAKEFNLRHIPEISYNELGTPRLDSIHLEAEKASEHNLLCIVNADIILFNDFMEAVATMTNHSSPALMVGQRWNLDVQEYIDFGSDWERDLRLKLIADGQLGPRTGEDYIVYPKGFIQDMPPFLVGRSYADGWLLFEARAKGLQLIEATSAVTAVHQNHDYTHISMAIGGMVDDPQTNHNSILSGGPSRMLIMKDRTHILNADGIKPARDLWRLWRFIRTYQILKPSVPLPIRAVLGPVNVLINAGRQMLTWTRVIRPYRGPRHG
tara:strand:+ start:98 stop:1024 length:927 start_codon:yes stop_codon:yes gene_type:complete